MEVRGLKFTHKSIRLMGSEHSGHHGHAGRPGSVGGSTPGGRGNLSAPVGDAGMAGNAKLDTMLKDVADKVWWSQATDEKRAELKAQVAQDLAKETGVTEEEASDFVEQWASSSNDNDMRSLAIQKDAADEFGLELSEFTKQRIDVTKEAHEKLSTTYRKELGLSEEQLSYMSTWQESMQKSNPLMDSPTQRKLLRAMYNKTQAELKARGITEVRVYRGANIEGRMQVPANIKTNALSSWSLSENVAASFAAGGSHGRIFTAVVPSSRILSFPTTGFGCLTEGELTVLGGKNDWSDWVGYMA